MPHPSKRKGNSFERELRGAFTEAGLRCERAYASSGEALVTDDGTRCTSDVDLLVAGKLRVQAKRRKTIASYLQPPAGAHVSIVRADRSDSLASYLLTSLRGS